MKLTKNFTLQEFACNDATHTLPTGSALTNIKELAQNLQILRDHLGVSIRINSGYRTVAHNEKQPGHSKVSQHLYGRAADLHVDGIAPAAIADAIERLIAEGKMKQGGIGKYRTFTHYDIRGTRARWNG